MPKYRKKPVVIEAVQFVVTSKTQRKYGVTIEHNMPEIANFMGGITHERTFPQEGNPNGRVCIEIETLEGTMYADVNDYIIKGINGEFYPCKPDIFAKTYDLVEPVDTQGGDDYRETMYNGWLAKQIKDSE